MLQIPLTALRVDPENARTIYDDRDINALAASMRSVGQLQAILVRPDPDEPDCFLVSAGGRRWRAAERLGWETMGAEEYHGSSPTLAVSLAENFQRAAMHPVDQWERVNHLCQEHGYSLGLASAALGLPVENLRRLEALGQMDEAVLLAMREAPTMPAPGQLRIIATAPHEVQRRAIGRYQGEGWAEVAEACQVRRIPVERAIFDVATSGVAFMRDIFAQPGDPDAVTTVDVEAFMEAQQRALETRAHAAIKGRYEIVTPLPGSSVRACLPTGWIGQWSDIPKRWRKEDPRKVFAGIERTGGDYGKVVEILAEPKPSILRAAGDTGTDSTPVPRAPISDATYDRLAGMKATAVGEWFEKNAYVLHHESMVRSLLLVLAYENITGPPGLRGVQRQIARTLVAEDGGAIDVPVRTMAELVVLVVDAATEFQSPSASRHSGPAAEWLAAFAGVAMPRCDTPEVLRGVSGEHLVEIAEKAGLSAAGTVTDLRKRLADKLPDWRPVTFGAPGPADGRVDDTGEKWTLNPAQSEALAETLINPPEPNDALRQAAQPPSALAAARGEAP